MRRVPLQAGRPLHLPAENITRHPRGTRLHGVRVANAEPRPWLEDLPSCAALSAHNILHTGVLTAPAGYRIVRTRQSTAFFVVTVSGRGRVLVDGAWRPIPPDTACLLPAHILEAFETAGKSPWVFCWVCYERLAEGGGRGAEVAPTLGAFPAAPLRHAIEGLRAECDHSGSASIHEHWVDLIDSYVARFMKPAPGNIAFARVWEEVATQPHSAWDVAKLASRAFCSRETLRRLSLQRFGRAPMRQVMHLRMRRAAELLANSHEKIETIAREVGYGNAFVFSNAFLKWSGIRPSAYRAEPPRA
jgi:AraC-like DNA-binding protein